MTDELTFTREDEHTILVSEGGRKVKYVLESDLIKVKGASEQTAKEYDGKITKHLTDLAEANRLRDESHNKLLQEQASREKLESDLKEAATYKTKVGELETKFNEAVTSRKAMDEQMLSLLRDRFTAVYKVPLEKVKSMDLVQLRDAEKNLALLGVRTIVSAVYDGKGGNSGESGKTDQQRLAERYPTMKVS